MKENVRIYYEPVTSTYDMHVLIRNLVEDLKQNYECEIIHVNRNNPYYIDGFPVYVFDCEVLIHFVDINVIRAASFADRGTPMISFFRERNNKNDILAFSQLSSLSSNDFNYNFKLTGSIYVKQDCKISLDHFYNVRKSVTHYTDKMYFRGNIGPAGCDRRSIYSLMGNEYFNGGEHIEIKQYFYELTRYKVGLCIPGTGELCHRDVEYMGIGIPMMKFEYVSKWNPELIPNFHYISIDRIENDPDVERVGGDNYKELYLKRYKEVKDDSELLLYISKNARKYYEDNLHPETRINKLKEILKI